MATALQTVDGIILEIKLRLLVCEQQQQQRSSCSWSSATAAVDSRVQQCFSTTVAQHSCVPSKIMQFHVIGLKKKKIGQLFNACCYLSHA